VLKKATRKSVEVVDVRADDPARAMEQFTTGLRQVLAAQKPQKPTRQPKRTK
jgi:hypothetical protein